MQCTGFCEFRLCLCSFAESSIGRGRNLQVCLHFILCYLCFKGHQVEDHKAKKKKKWFRTNWTKLCRRKRASSKKKKKKCGIRHRHLCNFPHPLRRQFFRGYALLEEAIFTDGRIFSYYMGKIWLKSWWKISSNWVWGSQVMKFEQIWTNAIEWHGEAEIKKKNHIFLLSPEIHWSLKPLGSSYCLPTFSCRRMGRQYSLCQL